jgi:HSP20 family protein
MARTEWDPLRELVSVQDRMNKLFESALDRTKFDPEVGVGAWTPVTDFLESEAEIVVLLELPGLELKEIDVRVDGDDLVVEGERPMDREPPMEFHRVERSYGKFARRFPLPSTADRESVEARYHDGVLRITLSKKTDERNRSIRVPVR